MLTLRAATPADATKLGTLHTAAWRETYVDMFPDAALTGPSTDERVAMWRDILGQPAGSDSVTVIVAADGRQIVGFGCCGRQREQALLDAGYCGEIGALYLRRSSQRRGAGRSLMAALARAFGDWPCRGGVMGRAAE